jgi:hypothetical protein
MHWESYDGDGDDGADVNVAVAVDDRHNDDHKHVAGIPL